MGTLVPNLLVFGRLLRTLGLEVHMGRMLDVAEALQLVDLGVRDDVYHACRALLVHRHEDRDVFDRAFDAFWRRFGAAGSRGAGHVEADSQSDSSSGSAPGAPTGLQLTDGHDVDARSAPSPAALRTWSDAGALSHKDFAAFTQDEMEVARWALDHLQWTPGERRTRRWVPGRGARVDLRRALAQSLRTGGDVVRLPRRRRRTRPRPIVLLCDVSGSMERYSRMLLHFAHALARRRGRVEAFVFSTRLTRITRQLRSRGLDEAMAAVSSAVTAWSGGTRIGDSLRELHQQWRRRTLHGGAVVLLISDGWDRGDPIVLREQIARLQRSCHRLVWLNPLIGTPGYEPLTQGLRAALPFVDDFLPARTLTNLAELALHLNTLKPQ